MNIQNFDIFSALYKMTNKDYQIYNLTDKDVEFNIEKIIILIYKILLSIWVWIPVTIFKKWILMLLFNNLL